MVITLTEYKPVLPAIPESVFWVMATIYSTLETNAVYVGIEGSSGLGTFADFAGIASFFLTLGTFLIAIRVRKRLLRQVELSDFRSHIIEDTVNLRATTESAVSARTSGGKMYLRQLSYQLNDVLVSYENILNRKRKHEISMILESISTLLGQNSCRESDLYSLKESINSLCTRLKKDGRLS